MPRPCASCSQKSGRARRQARSRRASAGQLWPVGAAGLFPHRRGSHARSATAPAGRTMPPCGAGCASWPTSGVVSAIGGCSCCLRREGETAGLNRIYRLYREEGLTVRKRQARRRAVGTRAPILVEAKANARWSLDFVHDQFANGRRFRILNIVDDVTRECLAAIPDTSISGKRVARELTTLIDAPRQARDDCLR